MTLNLTLNHLLGFLLMAYIASHITSGWKLLRAIAFIALWQLLTPVRPAYIDIPMMIVAWVFLEGIFRLCKKP